MSQISGLEAKLTAVLACYPVKEAWLFGSVARGTASDSSDIDVLVEWDTPTGLTATFDIARLKRQLQLASGRPVDVVTKKVLPPLIWQHIRGDIKPLYKIHKGRAK